MNFDELCNIVFDELPKRLNASLGLSAFARERAKFEGWLKVELCDILAERNYEATFPEMNRVDVFFENWAIELKTVNTNYRLPNVKKKVRPITRNIDGVIKDINKLRKLEIPAVTQKAVLSVVFPLEASHKYWLYHLRRITDALGGGIQSRTFVFNNGIPGVIYIGLVF